MKYSFWLSHVELFAPKDASNMLEAGYDAESLYNSSDSKLRSLYFMDEKKSDAIIKSRNTFDIEKEYEIFKKSGITMYCRQNGEYPGKMKDLRDAPYCLFVKGRLPLEDRLSVAVVGARSCTNYGRHVARKIGRELSNKGVQIISGLASGVDGLAQSGATEGMTPTYGVLGNGVDVIYPRENWLLFDRIPKTGGLISEYPPGVGALAWHFPMRNRIISGLSDAVIVVEARKRSGSLITAEYALEQGRDVYGVPGQIDSDLSFGVHELIRQGAGIYYDADEFLTELSFGRCSSEPKTSSLLKKKKQKTPVERPSKENIQNICLAVSEKVVYSGLNLLPKSMDELLMLTGLELSELMSALMELQLKGLVTEVSKNRYARI